MSEVDRGVNSKGQRGMFPFTTAPVVADAEVLQSLFCLFYFLFILLFLIFENV